MSQHGTSVDDEKSSDMNRRIAFDHIVKNSLVLTFFSFISPGAIAAGGKGSGRTLRLYRSNGRYAGRIEPNGRHYNAQGKYVGRVEGQRIYDAQGRYVGRFEESGKFYDGDNPNQERHNSNLGAILESDVTEKKNPQSQIQIIQPRQDLIRVIPDSGNGKVGANESLKSP